MSRHYSLIDEVIVQCQSGLSTLFGDPLAKRANPAAILNNAPLTPSEKKQSIGFMRVNHSGEVCAQALYRGQMIPSKDNTIRALLAAAAAEETDHLVWCQDRLHELGAHTSYLNTFWYINAFLIGILTGLAGDRFSLGFVEETEKQVEAHLESHLHRLPNNDQKSRKIVEIMQRDEIRHGQQAKNCGAVELPKAIKKLMALHGQVMTTVAYWV